MARTPLIEFVVHGRPEPVGNKSAIPVHVRRDGEMVPLVKNGRIVTRAVEQNKRAAPWRENVAQIAGGRVVEMLEGPLAIELVFYLSRPKAHYRTNGHLKDWAAIAYPTVKPDTDKLVRGVLDALTGIAFRDDSQVVDLRARKVYGATERCEVRIWRADPNAAASIALREQPARIAPPEPEQPTLLAA